MGRLGSAFYFTPETVARGEKLGLDRTRFYMLGRGGVLGDVEAPVVASAFGYFDPGLVAHLWNTAREKVAPRDAAREYLACAYDLGRSGCAALRGLDGFCDSAAAVVAAAEPAGLALFSGLLGEPLPDDVCGKSMHLLITLRELRGSAHLLAVRACGLSPKVAHYLRRPDDFRLFGWRDAHVPAVGDDERRKLASADALTDELVGPAYGVLDGAGRAALLDGLRAMAPVLDAALATWV